jgi:hypothetical protein
MVLELLVSHPKVAFEVLDEADFRNLGTIFIVHQFFDKVQIRLVF